MRSFTCEVTQKRLCIRWQFTEALVPAQGQTEGIEEAGGTVPMVKRRNRDLCFTLNPDSNNGKNFLGIFLSLTPCQQ
ncbi:mCG148132 [Mus musculus]|jgi:hypothetical protein|nr:mCG148132 [Mus musculus]